MARWEFLYDGALVQRQIYQKKCLCYSPRVVETLLREVGLPAEVPLTSRATQVLGVPVSSHDFCVKVARGRIMEVVNGIAVIGRIPSFQAQHFLIQRRSSVDLITCGGAFLAENLASTMDS